VLDVRLERAFERARRVTAVDTERLIRRLYDSVPAAPRRGGPGRAPSEPTWVRLGGDLQTSRRLRLPRRRSGRRDDGQAAGGGRPVADDDTEAFNRLRYEMQRALIRACHISAAEWEGDVTGEPRSFDETSRARVCGAEVSGTPARNQKVAARRLSEVIAAHVEDREGETSWTRKTAGMIKTELLALRGVGASIRPWHSRGAPQHQRRDQLVCERLHGWPLLGPGGVSSRPATGGRLSATRGPPNEGPHLGLTDVS
jgi:hypothetical protein